MSRAASLFLVSLLFLWSSSFAFAAAGSGFRITGVVVSSVDGTPVAHAHMNATLSARGRFLRGGGSPSGITADADDRGRFELMVPSAGSWSLTAGATGYVTRAYQEHENYSSAIVLTAAEPAINLRFQLPPEAEIVGEVLDEAGEAVRDARVTLQRRASESPNSRESFFQNRMTIQTDDRGIYEFANLPAGDYRVAVDARPWYTMSSQPRSLSSSPVDTTSPDPSLDVTYAPTWYPGTDNESQAEILSLKPADNLRADFHLVPIPAIHLQIALPGEPAGPGRPPIPMVPILERIDNEGGVATGYGGSILRGAEGELQIGGLSPGLYRMRVIGRDRNAQTSIIEIAPGSSRLLDASAVSAAVANISFDFGGQQEDRSYGVQLRDIANGRRFTTFGGGNTFLMARANRESSGTIPQQITLQVPPGSYEVTLMGRRDTYLTGMSAKGAKVSGRLLTVATGDVTLTLHTAEGFASIGGIVTMEGKPVVGALVLLVPAGLGDPASLTVMVRDQTNTDGSFDLNNVLPGPYILIAVDHGWNVNWKDPSALERYLTHGIPLDLRPHASLKQDILAQAQ